MNKYLSLILILFLLGCGRKSTTDTNKKPIIDTLVKNSKTLLRDSVISPKKIAVNKEDIIEFPSISSERIKSSQNTHPIGNPVTIDIGEPTVRTMGADTFLLPKKIPVKDSSFVAGVKEPIPALPMLMKDNAIYNIQYIGVNQGLNASSVMSALEDSKGNIWMGTRGGGVSRYDGTSFKSFTEEEGLCNNQVWSILEDKLGNIWFGTNNGITKYDGKYFTNYTEKDGVLGNRIWSIYEDRSGNIWFGTNKGLVKYTGKFFVNYTTENGLSGNDVRVVYGDNSGHIWLGTFGQGIDEFNGMSFTNYTEDNGLISNYVWAMVEDDSGNLWVGTTMGVSKFDSTQVVNYTEKNGMSSRYTLTIYKDNYGNLWFGTFGGGVNKFDGKRFTHYTTNEGLSNDNIWTIIGDDSENLWFATNEAGINKFNQNSFIYYTEDNGFPSKSVRAISEDRKGDLWFATFGDGIIKYDGQTFVQYFDSIAAQSNYVLTILEDNNKNLLFGTFGGGLTQLNNSTEAKHKQIIKKYSDSTGAIGNYINTMLKNQKGNIWMGTNTGLNIYNGESFSSYYIKDGQKKIISMIEQNNGSVWIGTEGEGVYKYKNDSITQYTMENGLGGDFINCILEDQVGNIWVGTDGGLSKYNGNYFSTISKEDGLSSNYIQSILNDAHGNLWVATTKGLNYIDLKLKKSPQKDSDWASEIQITVFHKEEGLKSESFYKNSAFQDSKNRIWWGNGGGLTMLDLNRFKFDKKPPQIQLNNIYLQQKYIDFYKLKNDLDSNQHSDEYNRVDFKKVSKFDNYPIDLELPYNINHLTFHFSAIDWYAPHQIEYKYKLEGLDQNWSQLSSDNSADYRNIPYGNYTFKVKAIGSADIWSETIEYPFEINPPWWYTWWAFTAYGAFVILTIVLIVWLNGRRLIANAKELQIKVNDATLQIRRQRDEVEKQRKVAEQQKDLIEENYKEITDSINYAERIQRSFLATKDLLDKNLNEYFIFFLPKAVVSGDFYWAKQLGNGDFAFVTADSTGHGVPGAIMSLLNITSIEKAIETEKEPSKILDKTRQIIINRLKNDGSEEGGKDGMDASLLILNKDKTKLIYSAANNPIWIVRNNELIELKYDRMPIGKHVKDELAFSQKEVDIQPGDMIYAITDGFPDQFGGPKGKKYKYKRLRELILATSKLPTEKQEGALAKEFNKWKGDMEQVDDVTIVGIKV